MRFAGATLALLMVSACASSGTGATPAPSRQATTAPPTETSSPTDVASPLRTLPFTVQPYEGQTAKAIGTIAILPGGYRLTLDASNLTPNAIGGQILNAHIGHCQDLDLSSFQGVTTLRPDASGQVHVQIDFPTPYALPPEGRGITIHGSGDAAFTHIACGALPAP